MIFVKILDQPSFYYSYNFIHYKWRRSFLPTSKSFILSSHFRFRASMATCCSSALAVSTLNLTHTLSSSRSPKNRQLYQYPNEFFMPSTISKFNLSRRNVFSVFNSVVNNSSLDESYTAVHEVKTRYYNCFRNYLSWNFS